MSEPRPFNVILLADAHVGRPAAGPSDAALLEFLAAVPEMTNRLVINGDLFDFWFEYGAVIPRKVFPWLAALAAVRNAGVEVILTGGNHDRWGGRFWPEQLGVRFEPGGFEGDLAGRAAFVHHGDGLSEQRWRGALIHRITRNPLTVWAFRWIHPDLGFWMVDRLYGAVRETTLDAEALKTVAASQAEFAHTLMSRRPELSLVVLSHVHAAALVEVQPGRWYVNPGPWQDQQRYAVVTDAGVELQVWP